MNEEQFFLGRQPIIGRNRELVAYELLFRSSHENAATVVDDFAASSAVIQYTFSDLGMAKALGEKKGFVNVSQALLMSDAVEVLPPERIVLEILETVQITPEVVARCKQLRDAGYTFALDDVVEMTEAQRELLPFVSVAKLDLIAISEADIARTAASLRPFGVKLLAEKVETQEQYDFCHNLGFDLFQGYFFAKPVVLTGRMVQPSAVILLKLFALTAADSELDALENALKQAPDLTVRLLKLSNLSASPNSPKISSIRSAIKVLGRTRIHRFLQIMLFAQQSGTNAASDPLVQTALSRGCLMEGLANARGWSAIKDRAFLVGMLSVVDALFGQPLAEIVSLLNLDENLKNALLRREGQLGTLLRLAEASERADSQNTITMMNNLNLSDLRQLNRMQVESFKWAANF
jgi:EAL and modified HD-GYP domain-containing signal transduction protein